MHVKNNALGIFYILLGAMLLLSVVGTWIIRLSTLLCALYCINRGLMLKGMPDLRGMMINFLSKNSYY